MSTTHLGFPYIINFMNLTQKWLTTGYVRSVRRVKQAPYPLVKVKIEELAVITGRRSDMQNKNTRNQRQYKNIGSSAELNVHDGGKRQSNKKKTHNKTKSGSENTSTNLAWTIFNNLNIFSSKCRCDRHIRYILKNLLCRQ